MKNKIITLLAAFVFSLISIGGCIPNYIDYTQVEEIKTISENPIKEYLENHNIAYDDLDISPVFSYLLEDGTRDNFGEYGTNITAGCFTIKNKTYNLYYDTEYDLFYTDYYLASYGPKLIEDDIRYLIDSKTTITDFEVASVVYTGGYAYVSSNISYVQPFSDPKYVSTKGFVANVLSTDIDSEDKIRTCFYSIVDEREYEPEGDLQESDDVNRETVEIDDVNEETVESDEDLEISIENTQDVSVNEDAQTQEDSVLNDGEEEDSDSVMEGRFNLEIYYVSDDVNAIDSSLFEEFDKINGYGDITFTRISQEEMDEYRSTNELPDYHNYVRTERYKYSKQTEVNHYVFSTDIHAGIGVNYVSDGATAEASNHYFEENSYHIDSPLIMSFNTVIKGGIVDDNDTYIFATDEYCKGSVRESNNQREYKLKKLSNGYKAIVDERNNELCAFASGDINIYYGNEDYRERCKDNQNNINSTGKRDLEALTNILNSYSRKDITTLNNMGVIFQENIMHKNNLTWSDFDYIRNYLYDDNFAFNMILCDITDDGDYSFYYIDYDGNDYYLFYNDPNDPSGDTYTEVICKYMIWKKNYSTGDETIILSDIENLNIKIANDILDSNSEEASDIKLYYFRKGFIEEE